jgi:hypothetical protein
VEAHDDNVAATNEVEQVEICKATCLAQFKRVFDESNKLAGGGRDDDSIRRRIITKDLKNKGFPEGENTCNKCERNPKFFMRDINNER